jgi:hypothetical protein
LTVMEKLTLALLQTSVHFGVVKARVGPQH